jgi:hypothetical protein
MKKIKNNKLALSTETLAPLTTDALDLVAGGNATTSAGGLTSVITRTFIACPPSLTCVAGNK